MKVRIFTDASWCPETKIAGWAAYIAGQGDTVTRSGLLKQCPIKNIHVAELMAIANGIHTARLVFPNTVKFRVHTDSMLSINALTGNWKLRPVKHKEEISVVSRILKRTKDFGIEYLHVRAHCGETEDEKINNIVDMLARSSMREVRDLL